MSIERSVTVVGLGYVGLPTAALLARAGYSVSGMDVSDRIIDTLNAGKSPLGEPEVAQIVSEALESGHLKASKNAAPADVFIICVPTPVRSDKAADLSMVRSAIEGIAPVIKKGALVILESTSPVGTTRDVIASVLEKNGLDPYADVDVCYCPERVFPGATVREILHNDRVVGGLTSKAAERAKAFYQSFCEGTPVTTDATSAEFSKLMENTYRDVNIALANAFARIAEEAGVDVQDVIGLANRHPRVNVHSPGPGVGGHCIPVDPWFLISSFPQETKLFLQARNLNDGQAQRLLDRAESAGLQRGSKVAVLGAAYRGDLDDSRESPTELLLQILADRGYSWSVHDPYVTRLHAPEGSEPNLTDNLDTALRDASAAIIMTDHARYRALSPEKFSSMKNKIIADGRRMLHESSFVEAGFVVVPLGAPTATNAGEDASASGVKAEPALRVVASKE